jgi:hypothetical protein
MTEQALQGKGIDWIAAGCSRMTFVHTEWPYNPAGVTAVLHISEGISAFEDAAGLTG